MQMRPRMYDTHAESHYVCVVARTFEEMKFMGSWAELIIVAADWESGSALGLAARI